MTATRSQIQHRNMTYYQSKKAEYPFEVRVTTNERPDDFQAAHPNVLFARIPMADRSAVWMFPSRDALATFNSWRLYRG